MERIQKAPPKQGLSRAFYSIYPVSALRAVVH